MSRVTKADKLIYTREKSKQQVLVQKDPLQEIDAQKEEAVQPFGGTGVRINSLELGFSKVWECMHLL